MMRRPGPSSLHSRAFERILLIKLSAMGDVIHALPVLAKLRARYPEARIDWLVASESAELVCCHPALSGVVPIDRRGFGRQWAATAGVAATLCETRRRRYQLVIDLQGQLRSAAFALASGAAVRIGFAATRERVSWAYTHRIPQRDPDHHAVERYLAVGELLDLEPGPPEFGIHLAPEAACEAQAVLQQAGTVVRRFALVVPGTTWETKHWSIAGYAAVCRHLQDAGLAVLLAGTARDRTRCAALAVAAPGAIDVCGRTTVGTLAAIMKDAAICVTNDSGPMHLAVALGVPLVAAFGPTSPLRTGPYGHPESVARVAVPCSPCYIRSLRRCPHLHRCMNELTPETMVERIKTVLAKPLRPEAQASLA